MKKYGVFKDMFDTNFTTILSKTFLINIQLSELI